LICGNHTWPVETQMMWVEFHTRTFFWFFLRSTKEIGVTCPSDWLSKGADKSLARPTSRYVLFGGENISFDASLVIYINSNNIPPIMIINRIYENQNLLSL
jgi:hypothetical protein